MIDKAEFAALLLGWLIGGLSALLIMSVTLTVRERRRRNLSRRARAAELANRNPPIVLSMAAEIDQRADQEADLRETVWKMREEAIAMRDGEGASDPMIWNRAHSRAAAYGRVIDLMDGAKR